MTTGRHTGRNDKYLSDANGDVRFFKPPNILRQKAGRGGFDPLVIDRANDYLDSHDMQFPDIAGDILQRLEMAISKAKKAAVADKAVINSVAGPVMELKANGTMFHYPLVSEIANILLNFLENLQELNQDGFNIINVHQMTLDVIIKNKLSGAVGREGRALAGELDKACMRYRKKYSIELDV